MASFNKVVLLGNLTRDPELRSTGSGQQVCKIGLAVSRNYRTQDGQQREEVCFVDVEAWGRDAENIGKYMSKGRQILIEGRLKLDQWEDRNSGQKRSKLGVVCERFQFISDRGGQGGGQDSGQSGGYSDYQQSSPPSRGNAPAPSQSSDAGNFEDEDVPF